MSQNNDTQWNLWEVFVQMKSGKPHEHAGSVHAPDKEMAIQNAKDTFARRDKLISLWVVKSEDIVATTPEDNDAMFDPVNDKVYRHPLFYKIPKGVNTDVH